MFAVALTVAAAVAAFHAHTQAPRAPAPIRAPAHVGRPHPSRPPASATAAAPRRRAVTVWLPYWSLPPAYASAIAAGAVVGTASPYWYAIARDSAIQPEPGAGDRAIVDGLHAHGIRVVPMVTESEGMRAFDLALSSPRRRAAMVAALATIAATRGYDGLDLDFEQFALDRSHAAAPADEAATAYPAFVAQVCGALHADGRTCSVTVMPRTSGARVIWRGKLATWVYDYGALAKVADRVQIMAYDEHAPGTPAGPVAPYPWVEQVVRYAASTIPAGKTELGLAAYGYDFSRGATTSMTSQQAAQLASRSGVTPSWDPGQAEATFSYGSRRHRHTVWYEDARAERQRAGLAMAARFAGVDLWYAGGEEGGLWPLLRGLFGG